MSESGERYDTPEEGSEDWHLPLNGNFEDLRIEVVNQVETREELPDADGSTSTNELHRIYYVHDSRTFVRDMGTEWVPIAGLGTRDEPIEAPVFFDDLHVNRLTLSGAESGDEIQLTATSEESGGVDSEPSTDPAVERREEPSMEASGIDLTNVAETVLSQVISFEYDKRRTPANEESRSESDSADVLREIDTVADAGAISDERQQGELVLVEDTLDLYLLTTEADPIQLSDGKRRDILLYKSLIETQELRQRVTDLEQEIESLKKDL